MSGVSLRGRTGNIDQDVKDIPSGESLGVFRSPILFEGFRAGGEAISRAGFNIF